MDSLFSKEIEKTSGKIQGTCVLQVDGEDNEVTRGGETNSPRTGCAGRTKAMSYVTKEEWTKVGDGQERVTKTYDDGYTREITRCKNGEITVTDTSPSGKQVSGDGVPGGLLQIFSDSHRINTW